MNLKFVKNESYEKGTDLMVVNVYMREICRQTSRVLFREQDFHSYLPDQVRVIHTVSRNKDSNSYIYTNC